ncbi:uncharacterized protein LOC128669977 isoform X2 [Plodia interpunctella]|uniref:uncharacterized protein LOC128669977 isoform X2 n=1 Tax=Plodia interpunctella TaxID=58824 RepID=UPI00236761A8|nr:uncharacterized protein LOC128669977 isoform X2 [Plodia interpunctella]
MSSTSSACDCDDFYSYRALGNMQDPWFDYYQTMGHPLIYYAKVQPSMRRNRSPRAKKGSPNFFVKAFRWYTQEHHPQTKEQTAGTKTPDFSNFANWLDSKYGQFIQENQQYNYYTSVQSPNRQEPNAVPPRSCNSCEFIMKPKKQMSITTSEHRQGNIRTVSETLAQKKSAAKSLSTTRSTSRVYDIDYQKSIDIVMTEGTINEKKEKCSCTKTEILTLYENKSKQDYNMNNASNKELPCNHVDVECQCDTVSMTKTDAHTQYDYKVTAPPKTQQPRQGAQTPKSVSNTTVCCSSCVSRNTNKPAQNVEQVSSGLKEQVKNVPSKKSYRKVLQLNDASCECLIDYENETTKKAPTRNISCQCPVEFDFLALIPAPVPAPIAAPMTAPNVAPVIPIPTPAPKSIDCVCTRSFQDAVKAICQQNITMVGPYKTDEEQIPMAPKLTTTVIPTAVTVSSSAPMKICTVPPSHFVVPAKPQFRTVNKVNETVQTSSHSICLDDVKYPLFMKIVRADKLIVK